MKILIPTFLDEVPKEMLAQLERTVPAETEIIASCLKASASVNRNYCLKRVEYDEIAIMLDDDILGFYPGWIEDLLNPFVPRRNVVMNSARLLEPNGKFGQTCSRCMSPTPMEIEVFSGHDCVLPTAAIAFKHKGHFFDEGFIGSGFEDSDWCFQYIKADVTSEFIQSNRCKLIHLNEMKNQKGENWIHNKAYFARKWKI